MLNVDIGGKYNKMVCDNLYHIAHKMFKQYNESYSPDELYKKNQCYNTQWRNQHIVVQWCTKFILSIDSEEAVCEHIRFTQQQMPSLAQLSQ